MHISNNFKIILQYGYSSVAIFLALVDIYNIKVSFKNSFTNLITSAYRVTLPGKIYFVIFFILRAR